MLKELLEALKLKFAGVSENILNRIASKHANTVTTPEQVKTFVDGLTLQQVIDSYADYRATEAQQTAVRNYETKHNLRDGVKIDSNAVPPVNPPTQTPPTQNPQGGAQSQTEQLLAQLLESNKKLNERLDKMDGERTTASRRQQVADIVSKLPENLRKPYDRISLDTLSDAEFETLKGELATEVDGLSSGLKAQGVVFGRPSSPQGGASNPSALTKEQEAAISQRATTKTDGSQPF